jgi:hypothetical protein
MLDTWENCSGRLHLLTTKGKTDKSTPNEEEGSG